VITVATCAGSRPNSAASAGSIESASRIEAMLAKAAAAR
jgi:hypothetical protein